MEADRKVYDSDLRAGDDYAGRFNLLREIAHTYCREYVGNFDMMIEARSYLAKHGHLPEGSYRPVLNTLRCDTIRQDLWNAVRALLHTPDVPAGNVVPLRPPHREYGGHRTPEPRRKATFLWVRVQWKAPFMTAVRAPHAPVVHLMWKEAEARWWRPRLPNHDLDMSAPLSEFEVRPRCYCKPVWQVNSGQFFDRVPTYDEAFPGAYEPGDVMMPFCRTCARLYLEKPELAVFQGEVQ